MQLCGSLSIALLPFGIYQTSSILCYFSNDIAVLYLYSPVGYVAYIPFPIYFDLFVYKKLFKSLKQKFFLKSSPCL